MNVVGTFCTTGAANEYPCLRRVAFVSLKVP